MFILSEAYEGEVRVAEAEGLFVTIPPEWFG